MGALVETDQHNVPRHTFAGGATPIEAIDPRGAAAFEHWSEKLGKSKDRESRRLLKAAVRGADADAAQRRSVRAAPLMALRFHLRTQMVKHILTKACNSSARLRARFEGPITADGQTALHRAARQGNTRMAEMLIKASADAQGLISALDADGYTTEDWASAGHFNATAAAIRARWPAALPQPSRRLAQPISLFAADCAAEPRGPAVDPAAHSDGGWAREQSDVPVAWMPPGAGPQCPFDTIAAARFNYRLVGRTVLLSLVPFASSIERFAARSARSVS